jgi:hypothetical protein
MTQPFQAAGGSADPRLSLRMFVRWILLGPRTVNMQLCNCGFWIHSLAIAPDLPEWPRHGIALLRHATGSATTPMGRTSSICPQESRTRVMATKEPIDLFWLFVLGVGALFLITIWQ